MVRITLELRFTAAIRSKTPLATKLEFKVGQMVPVYWQRSWRYEGPIRIVDIRNKLINISGTRNSKTFICDQLLPDPLEVSEREMALLLKGLQGLRTGGLSEVFLAKVLHHTSSE